MLGINNLDIDRTLERATVTKAILEVVYGTESYLAEFRKVLKLTQEELANKANLSVDTIRIYEKEGIPGNALAHSLYYYSRALNCSVGLVCHFSELQKELNGKKGSILKVEENENTPNSTKN